MWTLNSIQKEAFKYNTRSNFQKFSNNAYQSAYRQNLLHLVCSHMPIDKKCGKESNNKKWTIQTIKEVASNYANRTEFWRKNPSACIAAIKLGILEEVCVHMLSPLSIPEQMLLQEVRKIYPSAKKIRDKNFELDIYVNELNKAIEFDGTYWHSIEGLKRSRPNWSEEKLLNYHEIKDQYFNSKGILVLHVTEKEWKQNKEATLTKVFSFLG